MRALPLMLSGTLGRWFTESRIIAIDGVSFRNRQIHETLASNGEGGGSIEN
jgi:hypothetical protein